MTDRGDPLDNDPLDNVASLADPVRRAVYRFAIAERAGVDRNEVAAGVELGRSLAAYHLDRLVDDGLLVTRFEHRGTRRGPGSGRPSKIYSRAPAEFEVSLPPRDYALAAEVMASALDDLDAAALRAVKKSATARGRRLRDAGPDLAVGSDDVLTDAATRIAACGYEPYRSDGGLRLRNCPFDALTDQHRDLVCTMNLALLEGLLDAGRGAPLSLALEPADGECCVTIKPRTTS